jgi:LysM repeat protein
MSISSNQQHGEVTGLNRFGGCPPGSGTPTRLSSLAPRRADSYFCSMKRILLWLAAAFALALPISRSVAQDRAEAAAAIAARQDAEDRYQRLSASVQELQAANAGLQKKLSTLIDELQKMREEAARNGANYATREDLNRLAEKVREVDQKREADNRRILDALEKLAKTPIPAVPPATGENGPSGKQKVEQHQTEKGYWYEIKREDKLSIIVQEYRKKGVKVTLQQVKDANPDVNPNRLLVGQKIWIPDASAR